MASRYSCIFYRCGKTYAGSRNLIRHLRNDHGLQLSDTTENNTDHSYFMFNECIASECASFYAEGSNTVEHLVRDHDLMLCGFDDIPTMTSQMLPNDADILPTWLSQLPPTTWTDLQAITKALWTHLMPPDPEVTFANMMETFAKLVKSSSVSHTMRLYVRKCLDYHQAYESRFKTAWLDLISSVTASTLFSSTSSRFASSTTERQLQRHRKQSSTWNNDSRQSQPYLLGKLVGISERTGSIELEIWCGQVVTMGLGRLCVFRVDDQRISEEHCRFYTRRIQRGDWLVYCEDLSSTGTYFGKHLIGKGENVILLHGIQISLSHDLVYRYVQQHPITPHNQPLYPNTLGSSYLISDRAIGYGAQSKILLACHYHKKTLQYACKKTDLKSEITSKQAIKELNILSRLRHYSVVKTITSLWEPGDRCLIIMPIYDGGTLQDWAVKRPILDVHETRFIMHQICHAVDYIHRSGVIHRDLKPENILLAKDTRYPRIVVTDFGLAVDLQTDWPAQGNFGTPGYSAPEVHSGQEYDQAVDCWSMGAIFYFIWTGRHAFMLPDMLPRQLLESVLKGDFNQTSPEWINMNGGAKNLIAGLLTVNPTHRLTAAYCTRDPWLLQDAMLYERLYPLMNNEA